MSKTKNGGGVSKPLSKSGKLLQEAMLIMKASNELGFISENLQFRLDHEGLKTVKYSDFSDKQVVDIKRKMREITLKEEEIKHFEKQFGIDTRSFPNSISAKIMYPEKDIVRVSKEGLPIPRHLIKDGKVYVLGTNNSAWVSNFLYFHLFENIPVDDLSVLYRRLIENRDIMSQLEIEIDGKLVKKQFDMSFIDSNLPNNFERIGDGLDRLEQYRSTKRVYDTLTRDLKRSYDDASPSDKDKFAGVAAGFDMAGKNLEDGTVNEVERKQIWDGFFGQMVMRDGKEMYTSPIARYKTISDFIDKANGYLKSKDIGGFMDFYKKLQEANDSLGTANGAEEVFSENGVLILDIKSFAANRILNAHTNHCIKDNISTWDSYVYNDNRKQYYIYDFNRPIHENGATIGITINPDKSIRACHDRTDRYINDVEIKNILSGYQKEYGITENLFECLRPMSSEEIERRERSKRANVEITKPGVSAKEMRRLIMEEGGDPNVNNGMALKNASIEDDLEKAKLLFELGAISGIFKSNDSPIKRAKSIEMIKILLDNGIPMDNQVLRNMMFDAESIKYLIYNGLDPLESLSSFRFAIRGSWGEYMDDSSDSNSYTASFEAMMDSIYSNPERLQKLIDHRDARQGIFGMMADLARLDILNVIFYKYPALFDVLRGDEFSIDGKKGNRADSIIKWTESGNRSNLENKKKFRLRFYETLDAMKIPYERLAIDN